jgi:threonine dehydrogenase-like Zn-dependent dehydrogenase
VTTASATIRHLEVEPGATVLRTGRPSPLRDGWARVRVAACGVCGTDLHLLRGMPLPRGASYPARPGHEVAGTVIEGPTALGDQVVLHPLIPCGRCAA